ncbi:MAG: ABC transporter permease [Actinobacteria bacterium]|nr:ABC transporter permease [Actinomycetota bacterium]
MSQVLTAEAPRAWVSRLSPFLTVYWLILFGLILLALLAPWIAPYDPVTADLDAKLLSPSWDHLFGTDTNGMDVFSRVLWGARTDLTIAIVGVLIGAAIGVPVGAAAGYLGGIVDDVLSRISDMAQALPFLLFALMVFAAAGNSRGVLVGIIAFGNVPIFLRLTRSVVLPLHASDFIAAARCAGLGPTRIIARHVLPNALGPFSSQVSLSCAYAIQIVAGLAFIGQGVPKPEPEWGSMIQVGAGGIIYGEWWPVLFPGLAIIVAVFAFGGIGRQLSRWYAS